MSGQVARRRVQLFPSGAKLRVRGVQSGGKNVDRAEAGQRTAVNWPESITRLATRMTLAAANRFPRHS